MARFNLNFEMLKFFMYCMFPVGSLYIFNRPELQESFLFRDQIQALEEMQYKPDETKLHVRNSLFTFEKESKLTQVF